MAQLKDLIVTGASRFLNNIYGNLIGNASSADKVNNTLEIEGTSIKFDGSKKVVLTKENLGLGAIDDMVRFIGVIDTDFTQLKDKVGNGDTIGDTNTHGIFLSQKFASQVETWSDSFSNGTITKRATYYKPKVGDIVLQDNEEYICYSASGTGSFWACLDSTAFWKQM